MAPRFGWPRAFARSVAACSDGQPWPASKPIGLWLRRTDEAAAARVGGRPPLSVSSDRIARPAERAARLLTLLGDQQAAARDGSDRVIEVYPAGALRLWQVPTAGYKAIVGRSVREGIRDRLVHALGLTVSPRLPRAPRSARSRARCPVAALVGRGFERGWAAGPESPEDREAARTEGWLFVDFAGQTIPIADPRTGEITAAQLFVAVLGASSYT